MKKNHKYVDIAINKLCMLPQVREAKHSRIEELAESLKSRGLINAVNIVELNHDEFSEHLNFMNTVFKKNVSIDNFKSHNGIYTTLIAGHNRVEAAKRAGFKKIEAKLHFFHSSMEILDFQIEENIHEAVHPERRAVAIIGKYHYGLLNGTWKNKEEFIKIHETKDGLNRPIINEALHFANLPTNFAKHIYSGLISYTIGVELGRIYPLVEEFERKMHPDASEEKITDAINWHYINLLTMIQNNKSYKRSLNIIANDIKEMDNFLHPNKNNGEQLTIDTWREMGIAEQTKNYDRQRKIDYNTNITQINSKPFEYFTNLLTLSELIDGIDHSKDIEALKTLYREYIQNRYYTEQGLFKKKKVK